MTPRPAAAGQCRDHRFAAGDIMLVCDIDHAAIFQATAYDATNRDGVSRPRVPARPATACRDSVFPADCPTASTTSTSSIRQLADRPPVCGRLVRRQQRAHRGWRHIAVSPPAGHDGHGGHRRNRRRRHQHADQYGVNASNTISDASALSVRPPGRPSIPCSSRSRSTAPTPRFDGPRQSIKADLERTFTYLITLRNRVP